ncbi:hypothetical protein JTB14_024354 [Gonioctena quinquepunctata]|nr:hypothetical protein JTB14_024354 [Gonioctena quinquepunctata]
MEIQTVGDEKGNDNLRREPRVNEPLFGTVRTKLIRSNWTKLKREEIKSDKKLTGSGKQMQMPSYTLAEYSFRRVPEIDELNLSRGSDLHYKKIEAMKEVQRYSGKENNGE